MSTQSCYPSKAPRVNTLLDTLSNHHRREIIHYFENNRTTKTADVDALVEHLDDRIPSQDRDTLRIQLTHSHLPKLDERNWIDYDLNTGIIRYRGSAEARELLTEVRDVF